MRSKISIDEEEQDKIKKQNQLSHELNRTAIRFKELGEEFDRLTIRKDIGVMTREEQYRIIEISNEMESIVQKRVLLSDELMESTTESIGETSRT